MFAKRRISAVFLALVLSAPSLAADFEAAEKAYERGDYATALKELRPLAEQGDAKAQTSLGSMYGKGEGVPQDYAEAMKWHRLAAGQGNASAQFTLGFMYNRGRGVTQDYIQAHMWLNLAAGRLPPGLLRDTAAGSRDTIAKRMTPAQVAEAQRLAREWKPE